MKRMIDNKDYDNLKNSVSELDTKVNNIKDIKTITIEATQLVDETHAQLTDEQYNIINNNSFVKIVFPTAQEIGFNVFKGSNTLQLSACIGGSAEISYFSGNIDTTTKIVTLSFGDFSGGGKQLYQHKIKINHTFSGGGYILAFFLITHEKATAFTLDELKTLIKTTYGADDYYTGYPASGYKAQSGSWFGVQTISATSNGINIWYGNYQYDTSNTIDEISEIIVPL